MYLTKLASIQLVMWNILEEYNQDPAPIFKQAQLDPELMHQAGARYPLDKIAVLWSTMEEVIDDPCFGLLAAKRWHPTNFGVLGYALLMSTCLRSTLERLIRFNQIISDANFAVMYEDKDRNALVFDLTNSDEAEYSTAREDAALAWIYSVLEVNYQKPLTPLSIHLRHGRPKECSNQYTELFRVDVQFDAPVSRIELLMEDADKFLPSGNEEMLAMKEQVMSQYLAARRDDTLVDKVRKIIIEHLPSGDATVEKAASELFFSTRKLQRLLREDGTTFISLLNETRESIAKEYVKNKNMELAEIAFLLGFSEQSTFSRSFKRWTGESPTTFRNTL